MNVLKKLAVCILLSLHSFSFSNFSIFSIFVTGFPLLSSPPGASTTQMQASRNTDNALTNAAPMYITVGPQGCGKTTFLKTLHPQLLDISLDDQPDVYIPINSTLFLNATANVDTTTLNEVYHGKTLMERIQQDNPELTLILRRWKGELSPQNFAIHLLQHYQQKKLSIQVAQTLIRTIEETKCTMPAQVQVFVVESLFRPHPTTHQSAIQRAHKILRTTPSHIPVAWGNTNSKPRDYQMALEIACQARRPVHFLISAPNATLPWVPLSGLLARNLQRLSESGKYIPAVAIAECCQRVEELFPQRTNMNMDSFAKEQYLVQLAEPNHSQRGNTSTYRYRLTRNRLIQKEFLSSSGSPQRFNEQRHHPSRSSGNRPSPNSNGGKRSYQSFTSQRQRRDGSRNMEDRHGPADQKRPRNNPYPPGVNTTRTFYNGDSYF